MQCSPKPIGRLDGAISIVLSNGCLGGCLCVSQVPSVLFAPSHLMSIMSLGINSGLVMDCGYTETLVLPVYECIPILSAWEALPLGGKAIHK